MKYFANFKLNKTVKELQDYFQKFNKFDTIYDEVCFFVSSPLIQSAVEFSNYNIGAQNVAEVKFGAYTGETSIEQICDLGVKYVLVGHSERRNIFGETNEIITKKIKLLESYNVFKVLCVGEKIQEREKCFEIIEQQIMSAISELDKIDKLIVAYEPVWAIGTGITPTTDDITRVVNFIKNLFSKKFNININVLYGGSVNKGNIKEFKNIDSLDGFLVGGASLNPNDFYDLIKL